MVNLGSRTAQGKIRNTAVGASSKYLFRDLMDGSEYLWERAEIVSNGLYVRLEPYQAHLFEIHER